MTNSNKKWRWMERARGFARYLSARNVLILLVIVSALICGALLVGQVTTAIQGDATPGFDTALALFGTKVLTYVLAPLGGAGLKVLAGSMLGWKVGFVVIIAGDTIGSIINYYLGHQGIKLFRGSNPRTPGSTSKWSVHNTWSLLGLRILLSPAWDLISYGLGAKNVGFRKFLLASVIGGIPASIIWALLGTYLSTIVGQRETILIAVAGILLGFVIAIGYRTHHRKNRSRADRQSEASMCEPNEHRES